MNAKLGWDIATKVAATAGRPVPRETEVDRLKALLQEIHDDGRTPLWIVEKIETVILP